MEKDTNQIHIEEAITKAKETPIMPKVQTRNIEDLLTAKVNAMTEAELKKLVTHLRDETNLYRNKYESIKKAYEGQAQREAHINDKAKAFKEDAIQQIRFYKETIAQAYKTVMLTKTVEELYE